MDIIDAYHTYLDKRLKSNNKNVPVTRAEYDALTVLQDVEEGSRFYILSIDQETCSWYLCWRKCSKLYISHFKENIPHSLNESKDTDSRLKEILAIKEKQDCILFLKEGSYSGMDKLKSVLGKLFAEIRQMPARDKVDTKNKFLIPDSIKLSLSSVKSMNVFDFFGPTKYFHITLDKETLSQTIVDDASNKLPAVTLESILPDKVPDYNLGDIQVKLVTIYVSVDGYQNIFLSVKGTDKKEKVTLVYSRYAVPSKSTKQTGKALPEGQPRKTDKKSLPKYQKKHDISEYKVPAEEIGIIAYSVAMKMIHELRKVLVEFFKATYPQSDWLDAYESIFNAGSDKLDNLRKNKASKIQNNESLEELIDWPHMPVLFDESNKELNTRLREYFDLNKNNYYDIKEALMGMAEVRNPLAHFKESYYMADVIEYAAYAMKVAQILGLSSSDYFKDKSLKINSIVNEYEIRNANKQKNKEN